MFVYTIPAKIPAPISFETHLHKTLILDNFCVKTHELKAVIPAAGLGTRMLSITKEMPKEMMPLFSSNGQRQLQVKPLLQIVFEQLYDSGIREFCFIVGRGKRSIEDHFTPEHDYVDYLKKTGKEDAAKSLLEFYDRISRSEMLWINQHEPKGFGHAVLLSKPFVNDDDFLVHAGDTQIISQERNYLAELMRYKSEKHATAVLCVRELKDPKGHGIVVQRQIDALAAEVTDAIEKPAVPPTNISIMPVYVFAPEIFDALSNTKAGYGNEIQLTDGIKQLITSGKSVLSVKLMKDDLRLDVGNPESYWEAMKLSYEYHSKKITL